MFLEWVEVEDTYQLSAVNTLQDAVQTIIKFLGLGPANASEKVSEGTHTHTLLCSGKIPLILCAPSTPSNLIHLQVFSVVVLRYC